MHKQFFTAPSIKYCNTFESAIELALFEIAKNINEYCAYMFI